MLSVPATALLDTADRPGTRALVGAGFVAVAALEVVVGWGLYVLLRERAHSPAYAALVSRGGYAVLLTAAAGRLLWPGGDGVAGFRADWSLALVVLGVHLLVTAIALWWPRAGAGRGGGGHRGGGHGIPARRGAAARGRCPTSCPAPGALLPAVLGELVLLAWLVMVGWDDDGPRDPRRTSCRPPVARIRPATCVSVCSPSPTTVIVNGLGTGHDGAAPSHPRPQEVG